MRRLILLLFIVIIAGCGGSGESGTITSQATNHFPVMAAVQGTFSTAQGEYPITTSFIYMHRTMVNSTWVFIDVTSSEMTLINKNTSEEIPFSTRSLRNEPYEGPYLEWMTDEAVYNDHWYKVLTVDYVAPQKPPTGAYLLRQRVRFWGNSDGFAENVIDYNVE